MEWGMLGGEQLGSQRRSRTLGLGAAVRAFNELAVPGLGSVWFGKHIVLALLGIYFATTKAGARTVSNIKAANAVEALAVWWAYKRNGWVADERLRGLRKFRRWPDKTPTFKLAASPAYYVRQPMRIGTRDPLAAFGLVNAPSLRFNVFTCTEDRGIKLLKAACPKSMMRLRDWVAGGEPPFRFNGIADELDPRFPLPREASDILIEGFVSGSSPDRERRIAALEWVRVLRAMPEGHADWSTRPPQITAEHWRDMRAGARFAAALEAAAGDIEGGSVLDRIESRMGSMPDRKLSIDTAADKALRPALNTLRDRARAFLDERHDPTPRGIAGAFCRECTKADDVDLLGSLVTRDMRILRFVDGMVVAGPAFRGSPLATQTYASAAVSGDREGEASEEEIDEAPGEDIPPLPDRISYRVRNLYYLAADLDKQSTMAKSAP